jgi:hypothetical protein
MTDERADAFVISVVRSGGIAGMRRTWSVEAAPPQRPVWTELVRACPWDAIASTRETIDRRHHAELPDRALTGPWRELVDRVRSEGESIPARRRAADG